MNIDTLRRNDNTYRTAQYIDVVRCLNADHVTHLQRDKNVVAIRPGSQLDPETREKVEGWTIDRAPNGVRGSSKFFSTEEKTRAIRNILRFLNGTENNYSVGDQTAVEANQGEREAFVLATIGNEVLVEYYMPNGTTALRIMKVLGLRQLSHRTCSYAAVPRRWINAMHEQGTDLWEGRGQRAHGRIPFPSK